ncbi:MAG: LacI family DNA-binding transcriptional regulator [Natronospirillum sp.]
MATIKQVSKQADVSVATVSRVLNGTQWVAPSTRARVTAAMEALGYQPNSSARALATSRTEIIGLVLGDLGGPFFGDVMDQVEQEARRHDKHLLITSGRYSPEKEMEAIDFLLRRQVDALILHVDYLSDAALLSLCQRTTTPIVLLNRFVPGLEDRCIYVDNQRGGRLATEYLLRRGHRDIATVTGPLYKSDSRARLSGYQQALANAGVRYDPLRVIESDYTEPGGSHAMLKLLERGPHPSAVVCGNDLLAFGVLRMLKERNLKTPEDVAVVGYDDIVMSSYFEPNLTTVHIPVGNMGTQATRLAVALADKTRISVQQELDLQLIVRHSA